MVMKPVDVRSWCVLGSALVLAVACGGKGDDKKGGSSTGGSAGSSSSTGGVRTTGGSGVAGETSTTGGVANGGSDTGIGGSSPGGAASGGSTTGGTNPRTGGATGDGGTAGRFATGGSEAGGAGSDCPTAEPGAGEDCNAPAGSQLVCEYTDMTCTCPRFGPNADTWQCTGTGTGGAGGAGGGSDCPTAEPGTGEDCTVPTGFRLTCDYADTSCTCTRFGPNADTWQCAATGTGGAGGSGGGDDCPTAEPSTGTDCSAPPGSQLVCDYSDVTCTCPRFGPNADTWQCTGSGTGGAGGAGGGNDCPTTEPADGENCDPPATGPALACDFDDVTCTCSRFGPSADTWQCTGGGAGGAGGAGGEGIAGGAGGAKGAGGGGGVG